MSKELCKSNSDKMIWGVCGGIGEFFGISGNLVRLLFVLFTLAGGSGILFYLIAALLMKKNDIY